MVPTGSLGLVTKGAKLWWRRSQETETLVTALDPLFVAAIANHSVHGDHVEFPNLPVFQDSKIAHILLALRAELREGCPAGRLYGESLAAALAVHLLRRYAVSPGRSGVHKGGLPPARLRRVLDYIETCLAEDTSLRLLAELAQLSPDHFAALFKQSTGLPPHRYVLQRRIVKAKEMLTDGRLSLAEIGFALGFTSQAHFTAMFRKLVGATPGAYREEMVTGGKRVSQSLSNSEEFRYPQRENDRLHASNNTNSASELGGVLGFVCE
jgi:AraC family transcriptional regulator